MKSLKNTSIPFQGENQNCDHIEVGRNYLTPTTNIQWISPGSCTPYALGPIPFMDGRKATPTDCLSCQYFSGEQLLKCAINPTRMMDEDCAAFEAVVNNPSRRDERQLHSSFFLLAMDQNNPDQHSLF
jgi:hypothetical protein